MGSHHSPSVAARAGGNTKVLAVIGLYLKYDGVAPQGERYEECGIL